VSTALKYNAGIATRSGKEEPRKLPFLLWVIAISTVVACVGGSRFMGYNISGYAWVVPLVFSVYVFLNAKGRVTFPVKIWAPWIFVVIVYLMVAEAPNALQRSIMLLCPLFIGMTVSKCKVGEETLQRFETLYKYMAISLYVVVIVKTGILSTGVLPEVTGLAPEVMTGALLCTLYAVRYSFGEKKALSWWAALAAIPVVAVTRMGIAAAAVSLPATLAPMRMKKRLAVVALIVCLAIPVFLSERVQSKMFYSGEGTISQVRFGNPNLRTSGRKPIWDAMEDEIAKEPWFGHGANSSEPFVFALTGLTHPHNDWLRLLYDYGYLGTTIFGFCLSLQVWHLLKSARKSNGRTRTLLYAVASSFIIFVLFMLTDNIILYAAFFGNFQFTMLGLAYASHEVSPERDSAKMGSQRRRRVRIKW
jgi:O-Antigen ligase